MSWKQRISRALQEQRDAGLWREAARLDAAQASRTVRNGVPVINFCSNDYLGLAASHDALRQAASHWGLGSGASHLVCGHSHAHQQLQEALAQHTGYERALLFSTGYMANIGTLACLARRGDQIFQDKLNHASLLDGALLSRADLIRYRHNDTQHLQQLLSRSRQGERIIVSDSIFSMDGDLADLQQLAQLARAHDALLMIDDAHGFGVIGGSCGQGARAQAQLAPCELPLYVGTLGKALGGFGAFVAGSDELISYISQFARPYIYTTALPPALAEAMQANLKRLQQGDLQQRLHDNIHLFRDLAASHKLPLGPSTSAIQPLPCGTPERAMRLSQALLQYGFWVSAIRPPTVPAGGSRLRITLSAAHSGDDIRALVSVLAGLTAEDNK